MSVRVQVLGGYRRLLKASRQAFRDDAYAMQQARVALRENFQANSQVNDKEQLDELVKGIDEAESMLLHHIVQGRAKEAEGETVPRFEVKLTDPQRQSMRKDEEITPLTEKSASEPLVMNSGNVCQRPS
ncbi:Mitochondrial zinc maintenance protein 1 [Phytophthora citrophthora]|uniref:Mitochondrial zinc maintenance protein 1 n=1 Tax=Phytophthora citrophthora TaxID=4793 RepID=A0AAD9GMC8_9STRA|nr:Mitochondrial zinc maintenance protein 1 [Phytophthora citrophthora]